jgi:hypothetical protein
MVRNKEELVDKIFDPVLLARKMEQDLDLPLWRKIFLNIMQDILQFKEGEGKFIIKLPVSEES